MMKKIILSVFLVLFGLNVSFAASQDRLPTSNGTAINWVGVGSTSGCTATTEWACVDDAIGAADNATTYIKDTDTNDSHDFNFTAFAINNGSVVNNVVVTAICQRTAAGVNGIYLRLIVNGTTYNSSYTALDTTWTTYTNTWSTNPNTGAKWTKADVEGTGANPLQKISILAGQSAGREEQCTQIYVTVNYTPITVFSSGDSWE